MTDNRAFDWRICVVSLTIAAGVAYLISFAGLNFYVAFVLVVAAMFINGWAAAMEDERPGGFNDPHPKNKEHEDL